MATDSIFHNIEIKTPEEAERFVCALEKAEEWSRTHPFVPIKFEEVTGDAIKELTKRLIY